MKLSPVSLKSRAYPPALNACLARALAWAATFHAPSAISVCRRLISMVALSSPSRDRMGFFRSTPALTAAAILTGSPSAIAAARGAPVVVRVGASGVLCVGGGVCVLVSLRLARRDAFGYGCLGEWGHAREGASDG